MQTDHVVDVPISVDCVVGELRSKYVLLIFYAVTKSEICIYIKSHHWYIHGIMSVFKLQKLDIP